MYFPSPFFVNIAYINQICWQIVEIGPGSGITTLWIQLELNEGNHTSDAHAVFYTAQNIQGEPEKKDTETS